MGEKYVQIQGDYMQRMYPEFHGSVNGGLLVAQQQQQTSHNGDRTANEPSFLPMASALEMSIDEHLRSLPTPPPWLPQDAFRHPQESEMLRLGQPKMHLPHQPTPGGSNMQHMSNRCDARVPSSSDASSSSCSPSSSENIATALQNGLALDPNPMVQQMKQEPLDDYLPVPIHDQMSAESLFQFGCSSSSENQQPGQPRRNRSSSEGMLKCGYCPKKFLTPPALEQHMRECQLVRVHECIQCGKRFKARGGLQQHMRIHNNDRPYACHFCSKRFTQKSHVDQHERIHTGAKPFQCGFCGRAFRQRSQQMGHEATHIHAAQEIRPSVETKPVADHPPPADHSSNQSNAVTGLLSLSHQQLQPPLLGINSMLHLPDFDHHLLGQMM